MAQRGFDVTKLPHAPGDPCPLCGAAPPDDADDGEAFRRSLEEKVNAHRLEDRRLRDALKAQMRPEWDRQYEAARADALASVHAEWEGDARLFHNDGVNA
jgi:hypothetical protein